MTTFMLAFHGGATPMSPEESESLIAAWTAWMSNLGASLRDPGGPMVSSWTVASDGTVTDGGGANPVTGYTIIEADSFESARRLTDGCPIFHANGSVEILEMPDA